MHRLALALVLAAAFVVLCSAQQNRGYYRFPAVHGDTIVFTSEGDLWEVGVEGGVARRLTTHLGEETNAAFSPDGKTIAFAASYEGPREVYTMPAAGGLPARRTFDNAGANSIGWTPDGKILFSTSRYATLPDDQLAVIDTDNRVEIIPLSQAAQGCYDARGRTLFFTRLPAQGSSTKRYQGGTAQNIWKFAEGQEAQPLTADFPGTSKDAMWWNGRVYFLSDRDGTMNLWSMDENGKNLRQHTHSQGWDMQSPSLSGGRIVYQLGADLHLYDIASGADKTVQIELASDFDHLREHWVNNPIDYTTSVHLSPDGDRVVLTSRGRVFVAPAKPTGRFVDVAAHKPGRYRDASMLPDGKSLLVLSTESGEVEFWKLPANGVGAGEKLTSDGKVLRWEGVASPDGKWIAHQDKSNRLWLLDAATKAEKQIVFGKYSDNSSAPFESVRWSPDSRFFTFGQDTENQFSRVMLYSVETSALTPLTTDRYGNASAAWSSDGKWIYFLSDRALKSVVRAPWGSRQPDPYFDRAIKIYQLALTKGLRSPFEPADELHPDKPEEPPKSADAAKPPDAAKPTETAKPPEAAKPPVVPKVEIDLDRIAARIQEVPVPPGNYVNLTVAGKRLCWVNRDPETPDKSALQCLDIANKGDKPETLMEGVTDYEISADGKKMLVRKQNNDLKQNDLWIFDSSVKESALKDPKTLGDSHVALKDWTFSVIPSDEFHEAILDAWRLHRDYFYDPNMHHVNWTAMRDKYTELASRVHDREELNDLIAQMVSELSLLHTFVRGGDVRRGADQIQPAALGARLSRDAGTGGYVVEHIYQSDPDRPDKLGPLSRPGVDIAEGDAILAINGRELASTGPSGTDPAGPNPGEPLRNQAGKQVLLRVRPKGKTETREVIVKPISMQDDADLRYGEWEYTRRLMVEQASGGKIGYVHLRAMGGNDINQWVEEYSPVFTREGLIIDVRHNRGGNIDSWILGKLTRKAWMYWKPRVGEPSWNMQQAFRGHVVVLCDEGTSSDGEAFTEGFRRLGLGKVIGTRTWGGEVWLSFSNFLADRGIASTGEIGVYSPERTWLIEGHGVDPDIVVDNLPHATSGGQDTQLDAAIQHLERLIREQPTPVPGPPEYPDKSFHISSK
jgi:tricorn protease